MRQASGIFEAFAALLDYPGEGWDADLQRCRLALGDLHPDAVGSFERFAAVLQETSRQEREEIYTRTFDLNPAASLDIGWHLFGESYDRGAFLVKMRQEIQRAGLPESAELPDHLTHALRLLDRVDPAEAGRFAEACLSPALEKISAEVERAGSHYQLLLDALRQVIAATFATAAGEVSHE